MWTPSPPMSRPEPSTAPACRPARMSRPSSRIDSRIACAHRSALAGRVNTARNASPAVFASRPPKRRSSFRTRAWCSAWSLRHTRSPSSAARSVEPTMSVNRMVVTERSPRMILRSRCTIAGRGKGSSSCPAVPRPGCPGGAAKTEVPADCPAGTPLFSAGDGRPREWCSSGARGNASDVRRLRALGALLDVELDLVVLAQRLEAFSGDRREVDEDVRTTLLLDKAEPLRVVEPLHLALGHFLYLFLLCVIDALSRMPRLGAPISSGPLQRTRSSSRPESTRSRRLRPFSRRVRLDHVRLDLLTREPRGLELTVRIELRLVEEVGRVGVAALPEDEERAAAQDGTELDHLHERVAVFAVTDGRRAELGVEHENRPRRSWRARHRK